MMTTFVVTFVQKFPGYKSASKCIKISFKDLYIFVLSNIDVHLDSQFKCITSLNALLKIYTYCSFSDLCILLSNLGN